MGVARRKKFYPDFLSGAVFLFVVLAIPLTYYFGVARPQDIRKRAAQEDKAIMLVRTYKTSAVLLSRLNEELNKPEGTQDSLFDLDGNGVVNGVDYDLIMKNYESP